MLTITNEFERKGNKNQVIRYEIRNVHFDDPYSDFMNIGTLMHIGEKLNMMGEEAEFEEEDPGVYIYKSKYDENIGLRLYKDSLSPLNYKFGYHDDYDLVLQLQKIQPNVKLTKFPTGIVTMENKIIGTEIVYYNGQNTFIHELNEGLSQKETFKYLLNMIEILKELLNNGVIYKDVHLKNFMVDKENSCLNIIDFDKNFIKITKDISNLKKDYEIMISNIKNRVLKIIGEIFEIDMSEINDFNTIEEVEMFIQEQYNNIKSL